MKLTIKNFSGCHYRRIEDENGVREYMYFETEPCGRIGNVEVHKINNEYYIVNEYSKFVVIR